MSKLITACRHTTAFKLKRSLFFLSKSKKDILMTLPCSINEYSHMQLLQIEVLEMEVESDKEQTFKNQMEVKLSFSPSKLKSQTVVSVLKCT